MMFMGYSKVLVLILFLVCCFAAPSDVSQSLSSTSISFMNTTLNVTPESKTVFIPPAGSVTDFFEVFSVLPGNLGFNFTAKLASEVYSWVNVSGGDPVNAWLSPGGNSSVNFLVQVPPSTSPGIYSANFTVNSSNLETKTINLSINVTENVGKVNVSVKDLLGTLLPGSEVRIFGPDLVTRDKGTTGTGGFYVSDWLAPGSYSVEVSRTGYYTNSTSTGVPGDLNTSNVTVLLEPSGAPVLSIYPSSLLGSLPVGSTALRTLIIGNYGNVPLVNVSISTGLSWVVFNGTFIRTLFPGEEAVVGVVIGSFTSAGTYSGKILVNTVNGGAQNVTVTMTATGSSSPPSQPPGSVPIAGFALPTVSSVKRLEIVNCPKQINLSAGEVHTFAVRVNNTGNQNLRRVSLSVAGPFSVQVYPATADISVNSSRMFTLELPVPRDAQPGSYRFLAVASGDNATDSETFEVNVESLGNETEYETLESAIEELQEIIYEIEGEMSQLGIGESRLKHLSELVGNATTQLQKAQSSIELGERETAIDFIFTARDFVYGATEELSRLKDIIFMRGVAVGVLITSSMVAFVLSFTFFVLLKKPKKPAQIDGKKPENISYHGFSTFYTKEQLD
jgi:flagellin-like hook-associated protein FlgL